MTRDDVRTKLEGIVLDSYDFCIATGALTLVCRTSDLKDVYRYGDILRLEVTRQCDKFPMLRITFMEEGEMYERGYYIKHIKMKVTPSPIKAWLDEHPTAQEGSILEEEVPVEETKFKLAQEQVDNVKENLKTLEYCLENKLEYASIELARFAQEALKSVMDTLKVEV